MADLTSIRGIAFDLDGTLVNSAPGLADAVDMALRAMALTPAGEARVITWIGNGADVLVERALRWAGGEITTRLIQDTRSLFDKYYARTVDSGSSLFPDVEETLAALSAQGVPLAVVTNKPTPFVAPLLEVLGIGHYFSLIVGGDDVPQKKPHPAPLYLVMGKLGLRANELLFVGDSRNDIQASQAAGCPCVGMTYGYNYGEAIALSGPDVVLDRFADLLPLVGASLSNHQDAL
ncbi:phosphoglycolate phosphatase [Musicola paradisiaca]|uniref:Phosphoglycolate phosphatase n=1 Tax=Musicola paradisiaca (strain Ech703) TaxID=579405 RepID=C6C813_MUSP7|nr:phosphoglycolate phosphatase [Musicola paradisiaca]ACS84158.1 phosphoglycolate phosphatase [Musicola paradisiaca Ech703]